MLVPYNVDKRTKLIPFITYGLMAANIFFFLLSILISNFSLSEDNREAASNVTTLVASTAKGRELQGLETNLLASNEVSADDISEYKRARFYTEKKMLNETANTLTRISTTARNGATIRTFFGKIPQLCA
jgi:hypothetical protein